MQLTIFQCDVRSCNFGYLDVPLGPGLGVTLDEEKTSTYELPKHH
jgi:L-alanine-DL-glutamate epimerase-like enolase superfamily enzyme